MNNTLVFQSDFGLSDGAVSAMYGVALSVADDLKLYNLTHDIKQFDIWEASYRLFQTVAYWPEGTVFASIVDPGVGTEEGQSVAAKLKTGHYVVTPNNGTLTHLKLYVGIDEVREIELSKNMRADTGKSYTFYGRDLYANTGAKLASSKMNFADVGKKLLLSKVQLLPVTEPKIKAGKIVGVIDTLDIKFGSLWTNVPHALFEKLKINYGDRVEVTIKHGKAIAYNNTVKFGRTFMDVRTSEQIIYLNSLYRIALAINEGNFAKAYSIGTGSDWTIEFGVV